MAMTHSSSLLIIIFILALIAIPFHCVAFATPENSTDTNLNKNQDPQSNSKAENGDAAAQKLWCVAKNNAEDSALQASLDWACGPGGADCIPIQQGGPCYVPDNFQATASYAFNDYFLKHTDDALEQSCNFGNTAALSSLDPSHGNCKIPSSTSRVVTSGSFVGSVQAVGPSGADTSDGQIFGSFRGVLITVGLVFITTTTTLVFQ